jgi:hypothetical protein
LSPARAAPRHAYQVFTVNSQRLADMNATPFQDDIGYAAVTGTQETLAPTFRAFKALQPNLDPFTGASKGYFPWIWQFNVGGTDAIVPSWSSPLGVASHNANVAVNHISMGNSPGINNNVRTWLNNAIPRGAAHRAGFTGVPLSERNAYDGSTHAGGAGAPSVGGGLNNDAIIKAELSPAFPFTATFGTAPAQVGIQPVELTGMIRFGQIGTANFTLIVDEVEDEIMEKLGAVTLAQLNIAPGQLAGAGANDWVAFRVTHGRIGRPQSQSITGPDPGDGDTGTDGDHLIGYEMSELPDGQSPGTLATTPAYVLPPPTKGGPGNLTITFTGAVQTQNAGTGTQNIEVRILDNDPGINPDETLEIRNFAVAHPAGGVWNDLLIPYSSLVVLFLDGGGNVAGINDSSDENPAQIYQLLIEPGFTSNPESTTITVP